MYTGATIRLQDTHETETYTDPETYTETHYHITLIDQAALEYAVNTIAPLLAAILGFSGAFGLILYLVMVLR